MTFTTQISSYSTCTDKRKVEQIVNAVTWSNQYQWMKEHADDLRKQLKLAEYLNIILIALCSILFGLWLTQHHGPVI